MSTPRPTNTIHTLPNTLHPALIPPYLLHVHPRGWSRAEVRGFMEHNKTRYDFENEAIDILQGGSVTGLIFLTLTEDQLVHQYGLDRRPATKVAALIDDLGNLKDFILYATNKPSFHWVGVDVKTVTIADLRNLIVQDCLGEMQDNYTCQLTNSYNETYQARTDRELRRVLATLADANMTRLSVSLQSPGKPFTDWTLPQVYNVYKICNGCTDLRYFPTFECGTMSVNKKIISCLMVELEGLLCTTPLLHEPKFTRSSYVHSFLRAVVSHFNTQSTPKFRIRLQREIQGVNGSGPVDYIIQSLVPGGAIVAIVDVQEYDFHQGVAQNCVQLESELSFRKRYASGESDDTPTQAADRCFGIVSNAETWFFLECKMKGGSPEFKVSKPIEMGYQKANMRKNVEKILGHIFWLLGQAQGEEQQYPSSTRPRKRPRR